MPVENELKYILRLDDDLQYQARESGLPYKIEQGYVLKENGVSIRLRKVLEGRTGYTHHYMQTKFKRKAGKKGVIEISSEISPSDFEELWSMTQGRVSKIRYTIPGSYDEGGELKEVWEVDFFKCPESGRTYLIVAEIEYSEHRDAPLTPKPQFIEENIVYSVPRGDGRFSNRKLGNTEYATQLYESLVQPVPQ